MRSAAISPQREGVLRHEVDGDMTPEPESESESERSQAERWLTESLQRILGCEVVEPDQNFFELGGDSLAFGQLAMELQERYGEETTWIAQIFETPTIRQLALRIQALPQPPSQG